MKVTFDISNRTLALALLTGASFAAGAVVAAEFPSEGSELRYSGLITDDAGNPRETTETIQVRLYDADVAGTLLCAASESMDLRDTQGRFSVPMPSTCADALSTNGDAWAQITVGTVNLPRQKLGAVPFALVAREAQSAETAITVAPGAIGEPQLAIGLANRIATFEAGLEEVVAEVDASAALPHARWRIEGPVAASWAQLGFDEELIDSAHELDINNGLFTASRSGLYLVTGMVNTSNIADQCVVIFGLQQDETPLNYAYIGRQSIPSGSSDNLASSVAVTVSLTAGERLSVWAQAGCTDTNINADLQVTFLR